MKKKTLIMSAALLSLTMFVGGAYAASNYSVFVNGKRVVEDVKIINGTTYLPLRAVSEALGASVTLDVNTKSIYVRMPQGQSTVNNSPSNPTPTPTATPAPTQQATRKNPAKIGETVPFVTTSISDRINGNITITEAIRGNDAWQRIYAANKFNNAPDPGYEYILVKIKYDVTSNLNSEAAVSVSKYDLNLVSSGGVDYKQESVVVPEPQFDTKIYAGGSYEGWAAYLVKTSDPNPLLAYNRSYDGSGGVWFSLN